MIRRTALRTLDGLIRILTWFAWPRWQPTFRVYLVNEDGTEVALTGRGEIEDPIGLSAALDLADTLASDLHTEDHIFIDQISV